MSKEIKLPVSEEIVVLRDPKSLKQKDRARVLSNADAEMDAGAAYSIQANIIAVLIESWSFNLTLPSVDIASLGELEILDYDVLAKESESYMSVLFPQLSKSIEADADPKVITENFND